MVSVCIVNWNGLRYLPACLESIRAQDYSEVIEIIIVDNFSTDGSWEYLQKAKGNIKLIRNITNKGFAYAQNQAIKAGSGEYALHLNFDVELEPNFISEMVRFMKLYPEAGMISGKLYKQVSGKKSKLIDTTGIMMEHCFMKPRGQEELDIGQYDGPSGRHIFGGCGAAVFCRRKMLEDVACSGEFFDEDFVSYVEDVDLSWRAQLKGWQCFYNPNAVAYHERGVTRRESRKIQKEYIVYGFRNRYCSMVKNITVGYWKKNKFKIIGRELYFLLGSNSTTSRFVRWQALYLALKLRKRMLEKRKIIQAGKKVSDEDIDRFFCYSNFTLKKIIFFLLNKAGYKKIHQKDRPGFQEGKIKNKKIKKVVLIYTGITECGFSRPVGNEGTWINHGLCSISATLKHAGFQVSLIDLRRLKSWSEFEETIDKFDFQLAGLTMMSTDYNSVIKCVDIIKRIKPNVKTIVGGPHACVAPEELTENVNIDYVFIGEAEITIIDLLKKLEDGYESQKLIYGESPDLDSLLFADRKLFILPEEPFVTFLKSPFVTVIAGRGCLYNCSYCQPAERIIFGSKVRRRSVDNVIDELKFLRKKFRFKSLMIHDDCLTEDKKWVEEFCLKYRKYGFRQPFVCQSRSDIICQNPDMIRNLRDAGLSLIIIGFESGSQRILNFLKKGCTVEQNLQAANICHKLNIKIWANYMLGIPTETKEEQSETVEMIKKIRPYHCSPAYYTPYPGSTLSNFCKENNLSLIKDHDSYRRNNYDPKIKNIDYSYLKEIMLESVSYGDDQNLFFKKTRRFFGKEIKKFLKMQ